MKNSIPYWKKTYGVAVLITSLWSVNFLSSQNKNQDENIAKVLGLYNSAFDKVDKNKDKQLTKAEIEILRNELKDFFTIVMTRVTVDKNGKRIIHAPPAEQLHQFVDKMVLEADLDKNGELSRKEFSSFQKKVKHLLGLPN